MKLSLTIAAAILANLMFVQVATAQNASNKELNAEVDSEIEHMYPANGAQAQTTTAPVAAVQAAPQTMSSETKAAGAVVTQTVVVPAQQPQQQQSVQKQPETQVEGSPLSTSRADSIRRGRQEEELKTESKIVEKLEQSRMEDEKKRAQVLFGDKFETLQNQQQAQPAPVVIPAAAVQQAPVQMAPVQAQPVIINQNESLTRDAVREEVRAALSDEDKAVTPSLEQKYFMATAGIGQYPDMDAIKGNYSLGVGFGTRYDLFLIEGSFVFSNYTLTAQYAASPYAYAGSQPSASFDMNQYQGNLAAKYQLLGGFVRPVLGGMISYSYREYTANDYTTYGAPGTKFGTSHAIDLGAIAGVDLEFNQKISCGFDLKYMWNMANKESGSTVAGATQVEKLQYFTTGVFARVNF